MVGSRVRHHDAVTEYDADAWPAYRGVSTWRFDPIGGSTTVTQTVTTIEEGTRGFSWLAYPVIEAAYGRQIGTDLAALRDLLEHQDG
jgi:hypothetical protein